MQKWRCEINFIKKEKTAMETYKKSQNDVERRILKNR